MEPYCKVLPNTPVFSVTWSWEISLICWFGAQNIIIITSVQNSCTVYLFIYLLVNKKLKINLFEIEIFCTFDIITIILINLIHTCWKKEEE